MLLHFRIKDVNVFRAVVDVVDLVNDDGGLHRKFVILVFRSDARGNNRHENGNDTCAERARKTRNCQHFPRESVLFVIAEESPQ